MQRTTMLPALRIAGIYTLVGALWIVGSDRLLDMMVPGPYVITTVQTFKGWFFVLLSGCLIGYLLNRELKRRQKAEQAACESEEHYRTLWEKTPALMVSVDSSARIVSVSDFFLDALGYERHEVVGRKPFEFQTEESRSYASSVVFPTFLQTGMVKDVPLRFVMKSGETIDVLLSATAERDARGNVVRSNSVLTDVTERTRAEAALRTSQAQLSNALITAHLGPWEYDVLEDIFTFNDHFYKIFRTTAEEVGGYTMSSGEYARRFVHPDDVDVVARETRDCIEATDPQFNRQLEHRIVYADGEIGYITVRIFIVKDEQGRTVKTFGVNQDITERKRAEEDRVRLVTAIEQAAETVLVTDTDGSIVYVNPAFERVTGYSREEVMGENPRFLKSGLHDDAFYRSLWDTLGTGKVWRGHLINKKKDGSILHMEATISPVKDPSEKIVNFVAVNRDVTREMSLHDQLLQAQKMEAIGTLAGGVAHDFNNLLQVTLGYSELLLQEKSPDDPEYADLQKIFQAAKNGAELVQRLLTFSRKVEPKSVPLDLNRHILHVEKLLRRTIPKMINIEMKLADELREIEADPAQIEQILMNLAVNARDSMPEGGELRIGTHNVSLGEEDCMIHPGCTPGEHVVLTVSDTGHGMAKKTIEHIFEPFFTTKELGHGTGLGLAMVYGMVRQCHGCILCQSELGAGTTFSIYFPAIVTSGESCVEEPRIIPAIGTETLMLVDDEEFIRDLGTRILRNAGYTVRTATNGEEALRLFEMGKAGISAVILDLIMPGMGGKECLKEILKIDPLAKVLIASGLSATADSGKCIELGARGFVAKPFSALELLTQVRAILDRT